MSSNVKEFAKECVKIIIALLINFFLKYNQIIFVLKGCNLIVFITSFKLLRIICLSQDTTNLIV